MTTMLNTREVIDALFAAAATGDLNEVMRWWAPDGVLEDITIARAFRGHDEIREYLEMYYGALPDVTYEPIRLVIDGPAAVVEWAQPAVIAAPFDDTPVRAGASSCVPSTCFTSRTVSYSTSRPGTATAGSASG